MYNSSQFFRDYEVVEFPDEIENDVIPMVVISETWLRMEEYVQYCLWPAYIKSEAARTKCVVEHIPIDSEKCGKCPVNIKYKNW